MNIRAQSGSDPLFERLDLDYPGLERVRSVYQDGNLTRAKKELLTYFQHRKNRQFYHFELQYKQEEADENAKNSFLIKSIQRNFGDTIDWQLIERDKEWQFSLNRMNWFNNFIGIYEKTKDEKYIRAWMSQIESFIALGDPGYPRTIDTGRRLTNWAVSHWMFIHELQAPSITPDFHAAMLLSIAEQADFLYQPEHWRRYSNWGTFENAGLSLVSIMFPEFKRNQTWLAEVWFRMRFQLGESYHPDGMHIEVSPSYHGHELEVWFDFLRLAKLNRIRTPLRSQIPLTPDKDLLIGPANALMHYYKPTGFMPQVGDTDKRDERGFLLKLGRFLGMPDLQYVATSGEQGKLPKTISVAFPDVGYYIMRSGWGERDLRFQDELYLLFDCGSNQPWHAHFDMQNIVVTAYGHDLLIDPGRYTYNDGKERDYFKSTASHNTIAVDGLDQPQMYTPEPSEWYSMPGYDYVVGCHSSYEGVVHQRSVYFAKSRYWIVVDRLTGSESHTCNQYWHFSDDALNKVTLDEPDRVLTAPHVKLVSADEHGSMILEKGYVSYQYRQKVEAPILNVSYYGPLPWTIPTVIYPYHASVPDVHLCSLETIRIDPEKNDLPRPVALKITTGLGNDYFFEQDGGGGSCRFDEYETDARVAFIAVDENQKITSYMWADGTYLKYLNMVIARIEGTRSNVSAQNDAIDIDADFIIDFQFKADDKKTVFLNGKKLDVKLKGQFVYLKKNRANILIRRNSWHSVSDQVCSN